MELHECVEFMLFDSLLGKLFGSEELDEIQKKKKGEIGYQSDYLID